MEKNRDTFCYTYSALEQEEIIYIRNKYLPREEDKMERLRRLHRSATRKAQTWALVLGVIGALIMGSGMSLVMTDIGSVLAWENAFIPGIVIGIIGIIPVALAYPAYSFILRRQRRRIAPEILSLSEELLK